MLLFENLPSAGLLLCMIISVSHVLEPAKQRFTLGNHKPLRCCGRVFTTILTIARATTLGTFVVPTAKVEGMYLLEVNDRHNSD